MSMSLRTTVFSFLSSTALALLVGCATTSPQPSTGNPTPPPPSGQEAPSTGTPPSVPSAEGSAWQRARVGDRVVYAFSANGSPGPGQPEGRVAGKLTLEVVAVQQPWVWLKLSLTDEAGKPMTNSRLAKELIFPVSMEASRPLAVSHRGPGSAEQVSAAGRTYEATRYHQDNRPSDGPLEDRLYATSPGVLYLTHGLLSASNTLSGFGASGGAQLTLVEARQGAESTTAAPPSQELPLGPGTWSDYRVISSSDDQILRDCFSAEQGFFLSLTAPAPAAGGAACPSFAQAEVMPIEEDLLSLLFTLVGPPTSPETRGAPKSRGTYSANGRAIPSLTFEKSEAAESKPQLRSETFAANPWDPSLAGLNQMARFNALAETVESVDPQGKRQTIYSRKLVGWGTWAGGAK